jgi:divalent metal cation (Fe/Co/Zn/Cd) transporter
VPGVIHAHARARWTGRTLRVEIEGWVDPELPVKDADALGRLVADKLSRQLPEAGSFTWTTRAAPALSLARRGRAMTRSHNM